MFDILLTIMGNLDDETEILAFAQDLEDYIARARRLGFIVEVRDDRLARIIRKQIMLPVGNAPPSP
ncbi:hypothetical protein [Telmatospirillum sp.]|uniref:hypothetical protein n=1 Tax=Telmatospirillum sp. TaxID=2079197 RepID=UPI00284904F0|nr:hypothetical protein [Telmatospirillum sp.]MDR3437506.1 hypothetical protein [Telmatospirillum sp.]